jgi:MoaA/NifB/PqqE/SkfB family radical SAM enzyme
MKLEDIGFYTLSEARAETASETSRLMRCELILTGRCNFRCPYCRRVGGPDIPFERAAETIRLWAADKLYAIRFSGGEPTMYQGLQALVILAKRAGVEKIAVSTNGSAPLSLYHRLIESGVNDLSVSLDACCAADGEPMTGTIGAWEQTVENIRALAGMVYLTVGVVLTDRNARRVNEIVEFAAGLGVSDIRVIPEAAGGNRLDIWGGLFDTKFPILAYRVMNAGTGRLVRGLREPDSGYCALALDDMAVQGEWHYPCIIYMREGGSPIGKVGPEMRPERARWCNRHHSNDDPICRANCLDVCVDYNNAWSEYNG